MEDFSIKKKREGLVKYELDIDGQKYYALSEEDYHKLSAKIESEDLEARLKNPQILLKGYNLQNLHLHPIYIEVLMACLKNIYSNLINFMVLINLFLIDF